MASATYFHPFSIFRRAIPDLLIFVGGYLIANYIRFEAFWRLDDYLIPMVGGGAAFISVVYVLGLLP